MFNKSKMLVVLGVVIALGVLAGGLAKASGTLVVSGRWAGVAFANPEFDLDGDGVSGRQFDVRTFDQLPFSGLEGVIDSTLVGFGCAGPRSLELKPLGRIIFRGRLGESLYAEIDPTAPNLCFDPSAPNEVLQIVLAGGTGLYANASGTGTLTIHDTVRLTRLVNIPGVGPVPAPTLVDTRGEFTLNFQ